MTGAVEGQAAKKARTEASPPQFPEGVFNPALLTPESRKALRQQYDSAEPYLHCVMKELFDPQLLRAVRDEIVENVQATYKETDLFKVFQTGDLGNLDKLDPESAAKLPHVFKLKAALYSEPFKHFIQEVTGCGDLSSKTDCSCNVYAHGGHLLCHDDVIGTRRVSWIIYLTDPDEPWTKEDGGALELFPLLEGKPHTPDVLPTVCHLPTFNTMAMFTVLPGKSFHSVQEVYSETKPRMSISGWYHAPQEPSDINQASLQQLQMKAGEDTLNVYQPFAGENPDTTAPLSDADMALLLQWVNPAYLSDEAWPKVQARFKEDGSIQLKNFLKKGLAEKVVAALQAEDEADKLGKARIPEYDAGMKREGWEPAGPPHKQRYLRYTGSSQGDSCGALLGKACEQLFQSAAFARLLKQLTSIAYLGQTAEVRRFRPGLDYTVAHYGVLTKDPRLDVVLSFVDDASDEAKEAWEMGEVGGFEAYLLADEDKEGAAAEEVYRVAADQDESGVLNVSAASNTLNLVLRDEGLMKFVKYVTYQAPSSRWDVALELRPEDDSDDEEEEAKEAAK